MEEISISVIGTAGRKEEANLMSPTLYNFMLEQVQHQIEQVWKLNPLQIRLVSGLGSFSDHVAISLHRLYPQKYNKMTLYSPVAINQECTAFSNRGIGSYCNKLHQQFCQKMLWNENQSLLEIGLLKQASNTNHLIIIDSPVLNDQVVPTVANFFSRNQLVANSQYLIAFTFGKDDKPKSSGTLNTWNKCNGIKKHISLM